VLRRHSPNPQPSRRPGHRPQVERLEERTVLDADLSSPAARFVNGLYLDLLHRTPQAAEVDAWVGAMSAGLTPLQVALGFTASVEYRARLIQDAYQEYLGRDAEAAGVAAWLGAFQTGLPEGRLPAFLLGS